MRAPDPWSSAAGGSSRTVPPSPVIAAAVERLQAEDRALDRDDRDLAACREQLRNGSRTFLAASLLLPRAVREPACALYAFCRLADDEIDGESARPGGVERLRARLQRLYDGQPDAVAADRALAVVVRRYAIPRELPEALIEGFEWDAGGRSCETLEDLQAYAARVAGSVGAMMALLMGTRTPDALARACDLGVAMQLSNIARDVGEDARMGRLYLPRQWMREAGLDPDAWLAAPTHSEALADVIRRLLRSADELYARVDAGVAALPLNCRPGINAARYLYAAIGHEVERRGLNSIDGRAVVPPRTKARLLARAMCRLAPSAQQLDHPPLGATRYLVEAAIEWSAQAPTLADAPAWWRLDHRIAGVIELFERLEQRERMMRATVR